MMIIKNFIIWGENERLMVEMKFFKIGVKIFNEWERWMVAVGILFPYNHQKP